MRLCWHSIASIDAPAIVAASGCAPPMPPSPAVRIHLSASIAAVVLAPGLGEGLVGALDDALRADVDPRAGGHLAVHHQALAVELVEVLPRRPFRHEVRVGDQHARRVGVRAEHADRLARLDQQRFVVAQARAAPRGSRRSTPSCARRGRCRRRRPAPSGSRRPRDRGCSGSSAARLRSASSSRCIACRAARGSRGRHGACRAGRAARRSGSSRCMEKPPRGASPRQASIVAQRARRSLRAIGAPRRRRQRNRRARRASGSPRGRARTRDRGPRSATSARISAIASASRGEVASGRAQVDALRGGEQLDRDDARGVRRHRRRGGARRRSPC